MSISRHAKYSSLLGSASILRMNFTATTFVATLFAGLILSQPAMAGMVEVTLKKKDQQVVKSPDQSTQKSTSSINKTTIGQVKKHNNKLDEKNLTGAITVQKKAQTTEPSPKSKSARSCSRNYHTALGSIKLNQLQQLDQAYKTVSRADKSLSGKLVFSSDASNRPKNIRSTIALAKKIASAKGRDPWIRKNSNSWAARQLVSDMKTYISQPPNEFLCSGTANYIKFLKPYRNKIKNHTTETIGQIEAFANAAGNSGDAALHALNPQNPIAMQDQIPNQNENSGNLRSGLSSSPNHDLDLIVTNGIDDKGSKANTPISTSKWRLLEDQQKLALMQELFNAASKANIVGSDIPVKFSNMTVAKGLDTWTIIWPRKENSDKSPALISLKRAISDIEVLYYLQLAQSRFDDLDKALDAGFVAITTAHSEQCNCKGITQIKSQ